MNRTEYQLICDAVAREFVAAFPGYVRRRISPQVSQIEAIEDDIGRARDRLASALAEWAASPPHDQGSSPLELFREALALPTAAAITAGAAEAVRSEAQQAAVPGDLLDIAPATSRDLGEVAWQVHVAWGLARAEAIAGMVPRPSPGPAGARVALVGSNLMDRTHIQSVADDAGFELLLWRNPAAVADGLATGSPSLAFVDLTHPAALDTIRTLAATRTTTIAFGPHVDDHALAAAKALGADDVLPRSVFFRRLPQLFPQSV